jgi:hypothetical protein
MARNMFANSKTLTELNFAYEMVTSPENIAHDGERSRGQIRAEYARIMRHFQTRRKQLTASK